MKVSDGSPTCAGFSEQACFVLRVTKRAQHEARPALFRGRASRGGHALATCQRRRTGAGMMANISLPWGSRRGKRATRSWRERLPGGAGGVANDDPASRGMQGGVRNDTLAREGQGERVFPWRRAAALGLGRLAPANAQLARRPHGPECELLSE